MKDYSKKAKKLVDLLSAEEVMQVQKDNPFRVERNAKIVALRQRGVAQVVLAEISGLSDTTISNICAEKGIERHAKGADRG
ncbi:hypothetical protein [Desulfofustis glycolicus]|uniref:Uncharacterized protein n=1 Tax=Desulfofustis glycolicus DSM 9705 TaxID=1121409 RepID=A0A1M5RUQ4_9BACT|nr:hypothetical protein [Desulfofustis glycolicus]SHH29984.1 hypothetical protein SAMN02745124_00005 [Desulfofustis glycolicus DSM 9705]